MTGCETPPLESQSKRQTMSEMEIRTLITSKGWEVQVETSRVVKCSESYLGCCLHGYIRLLKL